MNVTALDVARAALLEVGGDVAEIEYDYADGEIVAETYIGFKATLLGEMAAYGPHFVTRCWPCWDSEEDEYPSPCTPVRDVLRGVTCGRAA